MTDPVDQAIAAEGQQPQDVDLRQANIVLPSGKSAVIAVPVPLEHADALALIRVIVDVAGMAAPEPQPAQPRKGLWIPGR